MGLWDAVSGKILRWNATKQEANRLVCIGLDQFVRAQLQEMPTSGSSLVNVRDALYAYFTSAYTMLTHGLEGNLNRYKNNLYSLNPNNFRNLIASLHTSHAVTMYHHDESRLILKLVLEGICAMYGRPEAFVEEWGECFDWLRAGNPNAAAKVQNKRHYDISNILGIPLEDFACSILWTQINVAIVQRAADLYRHPSWSDAVNAEIVTAVAARPCT